MEYTDVFSFKKPGYEEDADVADFNDNMDAIDDELYKLRRIDGEVYDNTTTSSNPYQIGDYVISPVDGLMYECIAPTYGTWDPTKWQRTTQFAQIKEAMQSGGGVSGLDDLDDVNITNPSDGQVLTYDYDNSEWVNADSATPTKTATGNPIELTDGADAPMVKCVTEIVGSQDLHGYDKPWVGGAGKNKLPMTVDGIKSVNTSGTWSGNSYTLNGVTFTLLVDNADNVIGIRANGTASGGNSSLKLGSYMVTSDASIMNGCPSGGISSTYRMYIETTSSGTPNWVNDYGDGVTITGRDTGTFPVYALIVNGASVNNIVFYPMIRLSTKSDPTFAPYSNICPITAYTEGEIEVRGKNLISDYTENKSVNSSGNITSDNGACISNKIKVFPNTTYTLSYTKTTTLLAIHCYGSNDIYLGYVLGQTTSPYTFSYSALKPNTKEVIIQWNQAQQGYILPTNGQLESGSTATPYEPYIAPTTYTTTYPSAIYRGSEDVVNGEVTSEMVVVDLGDLTWTATSGDGRRASSNLISVIKKVNNNLVTSAITNKYPAMSANDLANGSDLGIAVNQDGYIQIRTEDPNSTPTGQFAYELATPTTSSVTPTNLPIKSLSGYNHIESSTGEMEIEYITQTQQPLIDLIRAEKGDTYSTSEQIIGKWIDGSTLYRRTYTYSGTGAANPFTTTIDMTGKEVVDFTPHYTRYTYSGGTVGVCVGSELYHNNGSLLSVMYYDEAPPILTVSANLGSTTETYEICFSITYIKTVSNNRSLAKSAPTEEVKEEPEEIKEPEELKEEVKEEPEELKEEPEEKVEEEKEVKEEESK